MTDQKFRYTTFDGDEHTVELAMVHLARAERELDVSVTEWAGRLEPQLVAAHHAWTDRSADNRAHFLTWCSDIDSVDGHRTFASVGDGEPVVVPYRVFVEAERFFRKSFLQLTLQNTLNLRLFIVWRTIHPVGGNFDSWLADVPADFVCDVYSEDDGDADPKV